ncbi:fibronectin type III domain-containing protein [Solihabitans fulvus]|uniref:Fibronectin type III domain-containing protein n=1 Tax=Solihabitans fulvus TaxID=1892852 RepID=A0A5B2XW47_9PSEU|nr:fibronectin type III domain-containing protein [Solihabitans fulvus]
MVACCLGAVGFAMAGQGPAPVGLQFLQVGHWVYNTAFQSAFHIDGSTNQVDARASVPGAEPGSQATQGEHSGYVVERSRITEFSKSTLSVENVLTPPATEQPVVLEVAGGPYLVYRNAGQVVRLGDPMTTVPAGGPVSGPVATSDGTVWLHRIDTGSLCELPRDAVLLACPARIPQGHNGSLAIVDDKPVLIDTTSATLSQVGKDGLGEPSAIGTDLSATAQVANNAVDGRLAVADPSRHQLVLIDTAGLAKNRPVAKPVAVDLPKESRFAGPITTSHTIALVDETSNEVLTYDSSGSRKGTAKMPGTGVAPKLALGEDSRIYVDSPDGSHVLVVNGEDGTVAAVPVNGTTTSQAPSGTGRTTGSTEPPTSAPPPSSGEPASPTTTTPPPLLPPILATQQPKPAPHQDTATPSKPTPPPVAPASPPGAPGNVGAVAGDGAATVTWAAAAPNGAPVTGYVLSWPGGSTRVGGGLATATVTGLTNGTSYVITVAAENSAGRGAGASAGAVIPGRPADAPAVTAKSSFAGYVDVTWTRPDLHGGTLVHYVVSAAGQADQTLATEAARLLTSPAAQAFDAVTVRAVTRYGPPGSPTYQGAPGTGQVVSPLGWPSVTITRVTMATPGDLTVTVNATTNGSPTTCQASGSGGTGAWVPCAGSTDLSLKGVTPIGGTGMYNVTVNVKNAVDNGLAAMWWGVPQPASTPHSGPGGFVIWLWPAILAGTRRWKKHGPWTGRPGEDEDPS